MRWLWLAALTVTVSGVRTSALRADEHAHAHGQAAPVDRPKVFLDKSPRIVEYQLKRLDNARLLLVERETTDPRYAPVYRAILLRSGMSQQHREESLQALQTLNGSTATTEVFSGLQLLDAREPQQRKVAEQLTGLLLAQPDSVLASGKDDFLKAARAGNSLVSAAGLAGLIQGGHSDDAYEMASAGDDAAAVWLESIALVTVPEARSAQRPRVISLLQAARSRRVTEAAIRILDDIPIEQADAFDRLAPYTADATLREAAVQTLLKLPAVARNPATARTIVSTLVSTAESTPPAERTTDSFVDAMQLVDQLLGELPAQEAAQVRERLRAVTVRVIRIRTVHEEMRYDVPYFAVEAGRSVQLVLQNDDLMPHNLVVTQPGALQSVATAGADLGPAPGFQGLPFVPVSDEVLFATGMVEPARQERLTFTAPEVPGEYPYVCTFPRHWMRMYGVMVVVNDLDAWQRQPVVPKDPLGNTRSFIRNWSLADFGTDLNPALQGRTVETGAKLFREATCAQCHRIGTEGGAVGPALTDVLSRWKGDHRGILREILDPSWRIDPRYVVQVVVTRDGKSHSGIVTAEDEQSVSLLTNPEAKAPTVIRRSDIDEVAPTSTSMMPKALLDRFTQDEILEILHYIASASSAQP